MIDESKDEDVESLKSDNLNQLQTHVAWLMFMTKCPYVPPHDFNLDFPFDVGIEQPRENNELPRVPYQLAQLDRNGKIGVLLSSVINWMANIKNTFQKIIEILTQLIEELDCKYNSETFTNFFKKNAKNQLRKVN